VHKWRKLTRAELAKRNWFCLRTPGEPDECDCEKLAVWCCKSKNTVSIRCLAGRCAQHAPKPPGQRRARAKAKKVKERT
jgi:hypothetical protein